MLSNYVGFMQFQQQITCHLETKQRPIAPRHSAILRPKRTTRVCSGRRKQSIKAMRAVVQRVASATVEVEGRLVSAIGPGLLVLVGLHETDVDPDAEYICRKVLNMRLFPNEKTGKTWDHNVMQKNYEVLLVSQFTLYGVLKGNKPDFHVAMPPGAAKSFYASLVERFQKAYRADAVKDGEFGAMMKVNLVNDGPVTMQLDSRQSSKNTNGDETAGNLHD
ncbi:deacylase family protein [Perilla frutescens var. hirtella]|uniref:D-aminoacyl-tRNA deacylase n=1 Tax=Perilla frutescens var. hirtella TaxID=608512 RepID=A0AAD4J8V8_PERFH|nr:deacylase family protein [Perilla frutescens var. hirtella]